MKKFALLIFFQLSILIPAYGQSNFEGIVITRAHEWSAPNEISDAYPYTKIENHTNYQSVYYQGLETQIQTQTIIKTIPVPKTADFPNIASDSEFQIISGALTDLKKTAALSPKIYKLLTPKLTELQGEVTRYGSGNRKLNGVWMTLAAYTSMQHELQAKAAREESDAQAKIAADELNRQSNQRLKQLANSSENFKSSELAINELAKLKSTNPTIVELLANWGRDKTSVLALQNEIRGFLLNLKDEKGSPFTLKAKTVAEIVPMPARIETSILSFEIEYEKIKGDLKFPQMLRLLEPEKSSLALLKSMNETALKIQTDKIKQAGGILNNAKASCGQVAGGNYGFILEEASHEALLINDLMAKSEAHLSKAAQLESAGKNGEAIKEYEQANELVHDNEILSKIKKLREESLGL